MLVLLSKSATDAERDRIVQTVHDLGFSVQVRQAGEHTVIETGAGSEACRCEVERLAGVERVFAGETAAHYATRDHRQEPTQIQVGDTLIGGAGTCIIAGPCAVEGLDVLVEIAHAAKAAGAQMLRGGAYKPRTSPYAFRGLGVEGLEMLAEARRQTGLPIVTEVMDTRDVDAVERHADVLQIGSRSMDNFALLAEVGRTRKPVLLKRGMSATVEELLTSAEYVLAGGNDQVIFCERGIRTFERGTRNTLDISAVPMLRERSHLPVIVDPSHAAGRARFVAPLARAAAACGADGLIIETHVRPAEARSDAAQAVLPEELASIVRDVRAINAALAAPVAGSDGAPSAEPPAASRQPEPVA